MPMKQRFCRWYNVLKQSLLNFNIFRSEFAPTTDQYKIKTQTIATRVYLVLLIVSFFILITYTSQVKITQSVTVKYPIYSQFLNLYSIYSQTLSCPCKTISISYDQFIYLNASYHQVCESVYTTLAWRKFIDSTSDDDQTTLTFRYIGGPLFYVLSSFCHLSSTTITDGIITFNATQFISSTALPLDIFNSEAESFIRLFIFQTTREFTRLRELIRDQTQYDGLMSGLYTNFYFEAIPVVWDIINMSGYSFPSPPRVYVDQSSNCSCEETPFCIAPAFIDNEASFHVPGMYFGCYIVESLLQSNLVCFYNQSCIDELRYALNSTVALNTTALDPTIQSQYAVNETIENIVNQLMVEQWINTKSHELYYDRCNPVVCTYTHSGKNNWLVVLTSILVPIGGLNIILKLIVPRIIMILRSRRRTNSGRSLREHLYDGLRRFKRFILTLNLFHTLSHSNQEEEYTIQTQIMSTRMYLITLATLLFVLVLYTSQVPVTRSVIVRSLSYNKYINLYNNHSQTLSCPCTNINIRQDQFIQIGVRFHQVCQSNFVSDLYFSYLSQVMNYANISIVNTGKAHLQMIASWCRLANLSVADDRTAFYAEQFTVYEVLSPELFDKQVQSLTSVFSESTKDIFVRSLAVIQQTTQYNILASGYATNFFPYAGGTVNNLVFKIASTYYPASETCICIYLSNCTAPIIYSYKYLNVFDSYVYDDPSTLFHILPGLLRGCFIHEATLQSTLECFYNQSCLDATYSYFGLSFSANFTALDLSIPSQFNATSIIRNVVAQMMVEEWTYTSSHVSFYNACQPLFCSYSYDGGNDLSVIISTIVGLIGGLTTILMAIIPQSVKFMQRCRRHPISQLANSDVSGMFRMEQLRRYWIKGKENISKFNIFHSTHPEIIVDEFELKTQIISTRIFFIFLFVLLFSLAVYTAEVPISTTITIKSPSYDTYSRMYSQYSESLSCPCTTISIRYDQFLDVQAARFHQACQSVYATTDWALFIDYSHRYHTIFFVDFRELGGRIFQTLASFCDQSQEIITDELVKFNAQRFITTNVMALDLFESQSKAYIQLFISSTKSSFKRSIELVRETTQGNVLFTGVNTNLQFNIVVDSAENVFLTTQYTTIGSNSSNCSCQETSTCVIASTIWYDVSYAPAPVIQFVVPGIMRGCYILEAFLQSNLVCFYNQSCVDHLVYVLNTTVPINIVFKLNTTALDPSIPSQFEVNSTLGDIVDELMVEEWINTSSHKSYYATCNPETCIYSLVGKNKIVVVISTTIGLSGSLTTILNIVVPIVVRKIRLYFKNRADKNCTARRTRNTPTHA